MTPASLEQLAERLATALTRGPEDEAFQLSRPILQLLIRGQPAAPDEIAAAAGRTLDDVRAILRSHPSIEWDDAGRVVGLGLTLRPTPHRFVVEGRTLFTWCALDALLFPALLGVRAHITSPCPVTRTLVRVEVSPQGVHAVEPADALVSLVVPAPAEHGAEHGSDVRAVFCNHVHFLSSPEAAVRWRVTHPDGLAITVADAFWLGQHLIKLGVL
jgi:alkylmercury lyase